MYLMSSFGLGFWLFLTFFFKFEFRGPVVKLVFFLNVDFEWNSIILAFWLFSLIFAALSSSLLLDEVEVINDADEVEADDEDENRKELDDEFDEEVSLILLDIRIFDGDLDNDIVEEEDEENNFDFSGAKAESDANATLEETFCLAEAFKSVEVKEEDEAASIFDFSSLTGFPSVALIDVVVCGDSVAFSTIGSSLFSAFISDLALDLAIALKDKLSSLLLYFSTVSLLSYSAKKIIIRTHFINLTMGIS